MATKSGFGGQRVRVPKVGGAETSAGDELEHGAEQLARSLKGGGKRTRRPSAARSAHTSREQELRGADPIHAVADTPWVPPTSLDAPPPRTGFKQKWVRFAIFGRDDARNLTQKMREGWVPRRAETVPKSFPVPTMRSGPFAGNIVVEGSVLCEMPIKRADVRNAHYLKKARKMADEIDRNISRMGEAAMSHVGFGRVSNESAKTRVLTHAPNPLDGD